jgi:TolB protein
VGAAAATVLAAACGGSPSVSTARTPTPAPSKATVGGVGSLFYAKQGAILISDPAGAPGKIVTNGPNDGQPAPSPDGKKLVFVRTATAGATGGDLWMVNADGSGGRALVAKSKLPKSAGATMPRWSSKGNQVAFLAASLTSPGGFLDFVNPTTGALQRTQAYASRFLWSPDGTVVAWIAGAGGVAPLDLHIAGPGSQVGTPAKATFATDLAFSADGRALIFANQVVPSSVPKSSFKVTDSGIYSVTANSLPAKPTEILQSADQDTIYGDLAVLSSLNRIAFTVGSGANISLQIIPLTGGTPTDVISHLLSGDHGAVVWSAGNEAAFLLATASQPVLTIIAADGSGLHKIDTGASDFAWPPKRA